jgi:hypothetical protein
MASRRIRGYVLRTNGFSQKFFTEGNEANEGTEASVSVRPAQPGLGGLNPSLPLLPSVKELLWGWCRRFSKNRPVRTAITAFRTKIEGRLLSRLYYAGDASVIWATPRHPFWFRQM